MKKSPSQKAVPAHSSAGAKFTAEGWNSLQCEANRQGIGIGALLDKRGHRFSVAVSVVLPVAFIAFIKEAFRFLEVPESHLAQGIATAAMAAQWSDESELWAAYAYRSRAAAESVAAKTFAEIHEKPSMALSYRSRGKVISELFRNPFCTSTHLAA